MDQSTVNSAVALTAASFLVILSRTVLRRLKHEKFVPDDWLMLGSIVFYIVFTATYPVVVHNGINTAQTRPENLTDGAMQGIILGSKLVLVGRVFYMTYIWCLKACILIYYTRLTARTYELLVTKFTAGFVTGSWILCIFTFFLECRPVQLYWQVLPSAPECAKAVVEVVVMESTNIVTDFFILAIPIPVILRTTLSLKTKLELCAVFLAGLFIIIVSVLRIAIVLDNLTTQNKLLWAQIECFVATIVANAPILHNLWRHSWDHLRTRRFRKGTCVPEYSLNIRAPTGSTGPREISRELSRAQSRDSRESRASRSSRGSMNSRDSEDGLQGTEITPIRASRTRLAIRKSIRKLNNRLRRSLEQLEIETSVVLVQHTKTGDMTPSPDGTHAEDSFAGPGLRYNKARIQTIVSAEGDNTPRDKDTKSHISRFYRNKH